MAMPKWSIKEMVFGCIFAAIFLIILEYVRRRKTHFSYVPADYKAVPVAPEDTRTVTWLIHMYPPVHNAGAEWMAHAMNQYLIHQAGYQVNVIENEKTVQEFERVRLIQKDSAAIVPAIQHSAVLISHLDVESNAVATAVAAHRPIILVMHNDSRKSFLYEHMKMCKKNLYLIHNSKWLREYYSQFGLPSIVVHPPVDWREYQVQTTREYVTLINLNENKGGQILIDIARRMPDVKFVGVKGGYDSQILDSTVRNITYVDNTPYIKEIYAKTDILLVPSREESWGRVAIEAMSSGIPVIAAPTPGLLEACGAAAGAGTGAAAGAGTGAAAGSGTGGAAAAVFCRRADIDSWVREIRRLREDEGYAAQRRVAAVARAKELDPEPQLRAMAEWIGGLRWKD
jgi:glycosyltransferase involved in cell wall biosynthesis